MNYLHHTTIQQKTTFGQLNRGDKFVGNEYINDCGVFALTQEVRFLLGNDAVDQQILVALEKFQKELAQIQEARIRNATGKVKWLMAK